MKFQSEKQVEKEIRETLKKYGADCFIVVYTPADEKNSMYRFGKITPAFAYTNLMSEIARHITPFIFQEIKRGGRKEK